MDLSVIIVNYKTVDLLRQAIACLRQAFDGVEVEIVIVDNASGDSSRAIIESEFADCTLIFNTANVGFGRANNQALPVVSGRFILLLNTDAFVSADTVTKTMHYMDGHPKCGIVGVKLIGRDGNVQPSARYFPTPWNTFLKRTGFDQLFPKVQMVDDADWDCDLGCLCDWVPGCYYLVRRALVNEIGLFDPRYFLYYEEVDHCMAAQRRGWEVHYFPGTTVVHIGGESAKADGKLTSSGGQLAPLEIESAMLFFRKNYGWWAVIAHLLLSLAASAIDVAKRFLRWKRPLGFAGFFQLTVLQCRAFVRTGMGARPTR
jgi:hypothetical protein